MRLLSEIVVLEPSALVEPTHGAGAVVAAEAQAAMIHRHPTTITQNHHRGERALLPDKMLGGPGSGQELWEELQLVTWQGTETNRDATKDYGVISRLEAFGTTTMERAVRGTEVLGEQDHLGLQALRSPRRGMKAQVLGRQAEDKLRN